MLGVFGRQGQSKTRNDDSSDMENNKTTPNEEPRDPYEPPDGGITAWTQVLFLHIVFMNTWGVANGFGVFQTYYTAHFTESQSTITWIGSVQVCLLFLTGIFGGRLTDVGYFRPVFATGVFLQVFGIFMASLGTEYWQIFLAQSVCVGVGDGLTFVPGLTVMASYFKKRRAFAIGLGAAGAGTGGLIYPTLIDQLVNNSSIGGYPWTMRIMGFLMLATYLPCLIWFKPRLPPRQSGPWVDMTAFSELPFIFICISQFTCFWGLYFAFFFMGNFARDQIGLQKPINLVMVLNGVGIIGRVLPTYIADRWVGSLNLLVPLNVIASILVYCWIAVRSSTSLYVFAVLYGIVAAALQALYPAIATTMTPDPSKTGTRVGMIFAFVSIACLTGPFISGELIQRDEGDYLYAQIFAATFVLVAAGFALAARVAKVGMALAIKI